MSKDNMNQVLIELSKPFHPSRITWRPGALTGQKDKALAIAYADLRAYQNRLDEVCGMDWSVSYTPWGDRIICHLTINGITRSSTGEPDSDAEREEKAWRTAEAIAFTRACAMFGLGRYLYNLPSLWVEYDAPNQRFTEKAKVRLHGMIDQHYQRFLDGQPAVELADDEQPEASQSEPTATPQMGRPIDHIMSGLNMKLDELGNNLYGEQWPNVKAHNIKRLVGRDGATAEDCTGEEIQTLINGLRKLNESRRSLR